MFSAIKKFTSLDKATLTKWAKEFSIPLLDEINTQSNNYRSYLRVLKLDLESDFEIRKFELKLHAARLKEHNKVNNSKLTKTKQFIGSVGSIINIFF